MQTEDLTSVPPSPQALSPRSHGNNYSLREMLHTLVLSAASIADEQQEAKGNPLVRGRV